MFSPVKFYDFVNIMMLSILWQSNKNRKKPRNLSCRIETQTHAGNHPDHNSKSELWPFDLKVNECLGPAMVYSLHPPSLVSIAQALFFLEHRVLFVE